MAKDVTWQVGPAVVRGMVASIQQPQSNDDALLVVAHIDNVDGFDGLPEGTSLKYAHLLAAAPELLEACREVKSLLLHMPAPGHWADMVEARLEQINAAIAKAEGN